MTVQKMILALEFDSRDDDFCVAHFKTLHNFLFIVITIKIGPLKDTGVFFNLCFLQLCSKAYLGVKFGTIEFLTDASFFPEHFFFTKSHNLQVRIQEGKLITFF